MKRILASVLILVLLGSCVAYADTDTEILFRDIPWGISIDEVKNALSDFGFWFDCPISIAHWSYKRPNSHRQTENGWEGDCCNGSYGEFEYIMVEGYPCYICVYCAFGLDNHGNVLRDRESSEFFMASYQFEVSDIDTETVYEEFKAKMNELYGTGVETTGESSGAYVDGTSFESTIIMTEWIGANNTAVLLRAEWDKANGAGIGLSINYGRTDYDNQMEVIEYVMEK